MQNRELSRICLAAALGFASIMATAQDVLPVWSERLYATPSRPPTPAATPESMMKTGLGAPANVVEDAPRDKNDKQVADPCANDKATSEVPVRCRQWSKIANTF